MGMEGPIPELAAGHLHIKTTFMNDLGCHRTNFVYSRISKLGLSECSSDWITVYSDRGEPNEPCSVISSTTARKWVENPITRRGTVLEHT